MPAMMILVQRMSAFEDAACIRKDQRTATYSSRIQLPTDTPPQLMPPTKLFAILSLRGLASRFRFGLFIEIGFAPAKDS